MIRVYQEARPSHETPPPHSKRKASPAQDATRFVDPAAPGQEGVDLTGKVGSARAAPQPSTCPALARQALLAPTTLGFHTAPGLPPPDSATSASRVPEGARSRPSSSPQPRARGHPVRGRRTASASASPSALYRNAHP